MSSRANKPFIRVQPTFGSADLISSELFGHEKGAFTGAVEARSGLIEEANGGTLFIDEVDELPQETQVILLNVLQEKTYRRLGSNKSRHSDFRLIVATNMPLEQLVTSKKMREDFFHRVSHCIIKLPTLSQRQEDIESLSEQFLEDIVTRENLNVRGFSTGVAPRLLSYAWPGNIRELQATIESAAYRAAYQNKRLIEFEDFNLPKKSSSKSPTNALSFRERIDAFAVQLAEEALARNGNNQTKAAESLKLDRTSFRRILKHKRP
jgi:Nif-specific regulatory protein